MAKKDDPIRYKVRGRYPFPIDMLRYDRAYPNTERDSALVGVTDGLCRVAGDATSQPVEITLVCRGLAPHHPTIGRWRSFGWEVTAIWNARSHQFERVNSDAAPARNPGENLLALRMLKEHGLTFGDCVRAFGTEGGPIIEEAKRRHQDEGQVEIDDCAVVSISERPGPGDEGKVNAYVQAWVYVDDVPAPTSEI
jgi:hypothetical protein